MNQSNKESSYSIKSNEQRLKSLEEYERERQNKKRLIKQTLNTKTSHVKFDSDGDDDEQPKKFVEKKLQLFDDNNNNDTLNIEEHFNEKKVPKKRKKLQDLQARLTTTNDPRFQFSEKFLDEEINDNDQDDDEHHHANEEISFEEEKKKSLAILDQITNAKSSTNNKPKTKMVRFDPNKTEHKIYEIERETKINENQIQTSEDNQSKTTTPVIDTKRVYEIDKTKLKSLFDKTAAPQNTSNEKETFQFQFFNNPEPISVPVPKIIPKPTPISNGKSKGFMNKPADTSSDEDEHDPEREKSSVLDESEIKNETFFFFDIDNRLKDGLESFVRTEDLNQLERTWPTKRKEIAEALRTKHRKALQRKDKRHVFNRRRQQKQYSSASSKPADID